MGFSAWYEERIVPRLIRCACGMPEIMAVRRKVVPLAWGRVLEIGCGGGINLACYDSKRVTALVAVDPSAKGLAFAREAAVGRQPEPTFIQAAGESLPLPDDDFDCVVCTFTLCSVQSPTATLAELQRVMKPGGSLFFAEHGLAPDQDVQRWQRRVEPFWKRLAGGCHLSRPIVSAIAAVGFRIEDAQSAYLPGAPRIAGWTEWGRATRQK